MHFFRKCNRSPFLWLETQFGIIQYLLKSMAQILYFLIILKIKTFSGSLQNFKNLLIILNRERFLLDKQAIKCTENIALKVFVRL